MLPMPRLPHSQGGVKKSKEIFFQINLRFIDAALPLHPADEGETRHREVDVGAETSKCYPCNPFLSLKET